jgi:hypothetical protein
MTLTAVFSSFVDSRSVITGDALLWKPGEKEGSVYLPFSGERTISYPGGVCHHGISGTARKLVLLSDEAALAWAGQESVARRLFHKMKKDNIQVSELEIAVKEYLGEEPYHRKENFSLLGIIANNGYFPKDNNTIIFCEGPNHVAKNNQFHFVACGSGAREYWKRFKHYVETPDPLTSLRRTGPDNDSVSVIQFANFHFSVEEYFRGPNVTDRFGGAFDIARTIYDQASGRVSIRPLDKVGYLFWSFEPGKSGFKLRLRSQPIFQYYYNDSLVVLRITPDPKEKTSIDVLEIAVPGCTPHYKLGEDLRWNEWQADVTMHLFSLPTSHKNGKFMMQMGKNLFQMQSSKDELTMAFSEVALERLSEVAQHIINGSIEFD